MNIPVMKTNQPTTYPTEIVIWSAIGNTPITHRKGSYCDELHRETINLESPKDAKEYVQGLLKSVSCADRGYFHMENFPNQNLRTGWIS